MNARLEAGEILVGRFVLLQELGADGPTRLWLAEDRNLGGHVALRVLELRQAPSTASRELMRQRMREVCRNARRLAHPQILRVYDFHVDGDLCIVSREYVGGTDLSVLVGRPHSEIVRAILPIIDALEYAHAHGVVHGDLKPSKVVGGSAGGWRVADFGVARALQPSMASEARPSTETSEDIVALGALLQMLIPATATGGEAGAPADLTDVLLRMADPSHGHPLESMRAVREALEPFAAPTRAAHAAPAATDDPRDEFETIKPVSFRVEPAAVAGTPRIAARGSRSGTARWMVATFGLLLATALGVFLYLPDYVASRREQTEAPAKATAPPRDQQDDEAAERPAPPAAEAAATLPDEAKRLLVAVITAYDGLRARGAERWGGSDFHRAGELRLQGENALQTGDGAQATELLQGSLDILSSLQRQQPQILAATLERGATALATGKRTEAEREFAVALQIDPGNAVAVQGLARAGRLDEVLTLMRAGADAEQAGKLSEAQEAYAEAREIDPLWSPATEGLARVEAELADRTYKREMARAVKAVAQGDLVEAQAAYQAALAARPDSSEARAGLTHVERVRRSHRIQDHRRQAELAERNEDWRTAIAHYRAILDLDDATAFARSGLERSQECEQLTKRMTHLIDHPRELYDATTLSEAHGLLAEAERLPTGSPRLEAQRARLSDLVTEASTPVRVILESDSRTEVSVQRVGPLGTFERRELLLRPGTYLVRGIRRGYRDVRQTLTVVPGQAPPMVTVRCSEKI
jgi:tetratricopeptide (TPR) repeat protein